MSSRASKFASAVGVSPGVDGGRNIGIQIGSARSRSDGTVETGEAAGAEVAAVHGVGRGRGTRGGVLILRKYGRGAPPGPNP